MLAATPGQLVVLLYDGARRFLRQGAWRCAKARSSARTTRCAARNASSRHLDATLDFDQGELPQRLHAIYQFCLQHLNAARLEQDADSVEEVSELLGELREAWAQVAAEAERG